MANEFCRNIRDAAFITATFAFPTTLLAAGSKTSAALDLQAAPAGIVQPENVEFEFVAGALSDTIAPAGATGGVVYSVETSTTSTFSAVARIIYSETFVGTGSGVAAQAVRGRLPANCERYIRARVTLPTTATDASAVSGYLQLKF